MSYQSAVRIIASLLAVGVEWIVAAYIIIVWWTRIIEFKPLGSLSEFVYLAVCVLTLPVYLIYLAAAGRSRLVHVAYWIVWVIGIVLFAGWGVSF